MSYQAKGISLSIIFHTTALSLLFAFTSYTPVKKKIIALDFSITNGNQLMASRGDQIAEKAEKVKAVKPKVQAKPIEKRKVVEEVKKPEIAKEIIEEIIPEPEPLEERIKDDDVVEERSHIEKAVEVESEAVDDEIFAVTENLESNSTTDNSAAASRERYMKEHFMFIKERIEKQIIYPRIARRRGLQGKAVISFMICEDGSVRDVEIIESSGYVILDKNAVATVKKAAPFPKPPAMAKIVVPITYKLG